MPRIEVGRIGPEAAHALAPLMAAHVQEMRRGEPPRPDEYYAQRILEEPSVELLGARLDGELVGFAVFFETPDFLSGLDAGLLDAVFVRLDKRGLGIGRAMVDWLTEEGRRRSWCHLRWLVNLKTDDPTFSDRVALPAPWRSYVIPTARH